MVGWHRQGRTPDSSTRALRKSYQQRHLAANQEELGEGYDEVAFVQYLCSVFEVIFICRWLYFPSEERRAADFYRL
jgi:hypothetical protein